MTFNELDIEKIKRVYFIGIGGIGMSALARYFKVLGKEVSGYDRTATDLTRELEAEDIPVHFTEAPDQLPEGIDFVVYTPAVPASHAELLKLKSEKVPVFKRSEVLGMITLARYTVAVAGTHGKTTTSSMIAHMLTNAKVPTAAFLGGITRNYSSNVMVSAEADATVVEADEFDRSFLTLSPNIAVVTSMDADHLDIYGEKEQLTESFSLFAKKVADDGLIIYRQGLAFNHELTQKSYTYSITGPADYQAQDITVKNGEYVFDVVTPTKPLNGVRMGLPGRHNVENALAAIAVAQQFGLGEAAIKSGLESFSGVKRRFEYIVRQPDLVYIDDYAHHPEELKACIGSVREMFPGKKITGVFQPHLYSRTRDFQAEFAQSLALLDEVILLDIYPAREQPIPGVTSAALLSEVEVDKKELVARESLVDHIKNKDLEVLLTLGAGDIDQCVGPLKEMLLTEKISAGNE